jgi:5'-deoxynucleotidase YfbR-like HD superfamily hydrolase
MNDIQKMRERKSANEKVIFALDVGIQTDISEIRALLDPFEEKENLKVDKIVSIAEKIKTQIDKMKALKEINNKITEELGE